MDQLFLEFTAEKWRKCDDHVQKNENDYCDRDMKFDAVIDSIIMNLQDDSDTSSIDENENEDDLDEVESLSE
ncbi:unnamed protein product [Parnassius apollo]|uniref:(apollo) hypothetical protein n=1 Tax=Parnassius apollo TaxID=110799 RepID=A0A8S3WZ73_PARAO|nr:unnamed protein product [Parnassius apollo]